MNFQGELSERYSVASESGSSTDSHVETPENKDGESLLPLCFFFLKISPNAYAAAVSICWQKCFRKSFVSFFPSTVKKKYGAGLKFSNLMNIGKKKTSSLEGPEKCVDTSGEQGSTVHIMPDYKIPQNAPVVTQMHFFSLNTVIVCSVALIG